MKKLVLELDDQTYEELNELSRISLWQKEMTEENWAIARRMRIEMLIWRAWHKYEKRCKKEGRIPRKLDWGSIKDDYSDLPTLPKIKHKRVK